MADFVLVTCKSEQQKSHAFFGILKAWLAGILLNKESVLKTRLISFKERLTVAILQLPCTPAKLSRMSTNKIHKIMAAGMSECKSVLFYLPDALEYKSSGVKDGLVCPRSVNLFTACVPEILDELYTKRGKKLGNLELIIIQGPDLDEMFEVIKYIAPHFKYVTAVVGDRDTAMKEADAVYDEYGLPVGLSTDVRLSLKGADIVISMAEADFFSKSVRIPAGTLVIDLCGDGISAKSDGGVVIKGLSAAFPEDFMPVLGSEILKTYDINKLTELALMLIEGFRPGEKLTGLKELSCFYSCFKKRGFVVESVTGRHGKYRLGDIKLQSVEVKDTV